jgi:hypothetical protein
MLVLEVGPDDVDWGLLTSCQRDAADGLYAMALAAFIRWLAPRYEAVRASLRTATAWLRQQAASSGAHRRTPEIVADLAFGLGSFLAFSLEIGAISVEEADALWASAWDALGRAAADQAEHQAASEPARRFLELLASAISSGRAHVTSERAAAPAAPEAWGWQRRPAAGGPYDADLWMPQGRRVGWLTEEGLFLDPTAAQHHRSDDVPR